MAEYKVNSRHVEDLANGRPVEPGQVVDLSSEDVEKPHNQRLIEEGVLLPVASEEERNEADHKALVAKAEELNIEGALKRMSPETLREKINEAEQEKLESGDVGDNDDNGGSS